MTELLINPWKEFEDKADSQLPVATLQIYDYIGKNLTKRQDALEINRASAATLCPKRRWYQKRGTQGIPITPRKISNFMQGDIAEAVVLSLVHRACVGPGLLYSEVDFGIVVGQFTIQSGYVINQYKQPDLVTDMAGIRIIGHADGWGKRNSDGQWELIEVKSAADYGYDEFKEKGPGDYLKQSHVLMQSDLGIARKVKTVRFFYLKKQTGHIWDLDISFDQAIYDAVVREYALSNQGSEPEAPYKVVPETIRKKPTGRMIASFPCSYCPYVERCLGVKKEFKEAWGGGMSPVFYK